MKKFLIALICCLCIGGLTLVGCGENLKANPPLDPSITTPSTPETPETPDTPETPTTPDTPETPETPEDPEETPQEPDDSTDDEKDQGVPMELQERFKDYFLENCLIYMFADPELDVTFELGQNIKIKINMISYYFDIVSGVKDLINAFYQDNAQNDTYNDITFNTNFEDCGDYCLVTLSLKNS